ncbi:MAG: phosphoenolpyruvate---glycerone phosphotransferase subunit DhaL [Eubacteriaceae bacterium]|jgi:dihydroxyacetone kinase-like protein|nr:phosphoenolpyruvate---glycerone phosphotransferase subunit DhaL [Eubacteriaceae bacterium]MDK2904299.1 phosphoenolpyruvate---glycerone phosphotransferase subunit DhaL [Eubacteriaceae bacterium]MDK2936640.1 phosphoenolpyruvate---glycerone phosphotransferase subunit DhaL [Eubacteriaceae bacterium]MDK2960966.1 phosphoenolpyruvate---glycerone phosphotransferase subunit DhaL [Eubacteriaceae bacterium]MDN5306692.1 phosphoenolpyruvate---glycerone phosphotransferase subunit DhaL [Eubacteriaceae bact
MATKVEVLDFIRLFADKMTEHRQELTDLDQAIGDGDHGINMSRGMKAVIEKLPTFEEKGTDEILKSVGMTLVSTVGGASGPLYGTAFMKAGMVVKGKDELSEQDIINMFQEAIVGIQSRGKAVKGEKTMLDSIMPALDQIKASIEAGDSIEDAIVKGEQAAWDGVEFTKTIIATKGRASYLGERSIGHQDPGATSMAYLFQAAKEIAKK